MPNSVVSTSTLEIVRQSSDNSTSELSPANSSCIAVDKNFTSPKLVPVSIVTLRRAPCSKAKEPCTKTNSLIWMVASPT